MVKSRVVKDANPIGQQSSLLLLCIVAFVGWTQPGLSIAANADDVSVRREMWVDRLLQQIDQLPDENDRQLVVIALAEAGQAQRAKSLVGEKLSESKRPGITMLIADAQSSHGDVPGALQTLDGLPKESELRDRGLALVAIRQAQRGDVAAAQRVIEGLKDQFSLDHARKAIAKAQARAGHQRSATATAELIRDGYLQREARTAITASETGGSFSPEQIPSPFLSGQIGALTLFSNDSPWKTHAFLTLAASYRKDEKALTSEAQETLAQLKGLPNGVERATGYAILAVAFCEAGKSTLAENAGEDALKAMSGDIVGVSSLFGKPIVIYAMIQLGHYEHIDKILEATEKNQDPLTSAVASSDIQAIGAALVEKREDQRLNRIYQQLTPINRAHLAIGVICGLARPTKLDQDGGRLQ